MHGLLKCNLKCARYTESRAKSTQKMHYFCNCSLKKFLIYDSGLKINYFLKSSLKCSNNALVFKNAAKKVQDAFLFSNTASRICMLHTYFTAESFYTVVMSCIYNSNKSFTFMGCPTYMSELFTNPCHPLTAISFRRKTFSHRCSASTRAER